MFTSGFFNSVNSDRRYNAEQMSAIFDGIIRDGIFDSVGDHFAVTPGTGLAVNVGTGRAWLNSTWSYNDTAYPVALSAASASLNRIDLICIKVDKSSNVRTNSIVCIEGTPASSPVEPTVTDDTTNEIYYHKLAAVSVAAGATSISAADITNYVGLAAGTPYVTGILSSTTVDELWSQWDGEFNDWWDDIKATLDDNIVTTILNKIDHITPKESTMNLYGFSHINPPPAGKTYQEYSTDAILNQISSLLNEQTSAQMLVYTGTGVPNDYTILSATSDRSDNTTYYFAFVKSDNVYEIEFNKPINAIMYLGLSTNTSKNNMFLINVHTASYTTGMVLGKNVSLNYNVTQLTARESKAAPVISITPPSMNDAYAAAFEASNSSWTFTKAYYVNFVSFIGNKVVFRTLRGLNMGTSYNESDVPTKLANAFGNNSAGVTYSVIGFS